MTLEAIVQRTKAHYCLECGICTGSCPISRWNPKFSPRLMVERALLEPEDELYLDPELWSCLTCGACSRRCPSTVDYNEFTRTSRQEAKAIGQVGVCTHAGTIQAVQELQTSDFFHKDTRWLTRGLKVSERSEYLYFVGCLPQFQIIFDDLNVNSLNPARSTVKILNSLGVAPTISPQERCCGHDLYWTGDFANFKKLALHNLAMIAESGAKCVVFSCPEGYATFKHLYPKFFKKLKFDIVHVIELVADSVKRGQLEFKKNSGKLTYQDPCRLGRFMGIYEEPRTILRNIPGVEFQEMARSGPDALCCGSSGWVNCSRVNKKIQLERLQEAADTGAETLITACPKCSIHLSCAIRDDDCDVQIVTKDITTLIADSLGGKRVPK
ncbi:MAG: (Fe-S)-binding protein [bacterium]